MYVCMYKRWSDLRSDSLYFIVCSISKHAFLDFTLDFMVYNLKSSWLYLANLCSLLSSDLAYPATLFPDLLGPVSGC